MNQLTKLIEQYEKKNPGKKARKSGKWSFALDFTIWQANEIEKLASRPTCGKEQRLFLDEIREKAFVNKQGEISVNGVNLHALDFESDIEKVIKGE